MTTFLSQILTPAVSLYAFVLVSQFADGLYLGREIEPPGTFALLRWLVLLWLIGWWLRADSWKRRVALVYDFGFYLFIAWPVAMFYYLVKTRGVRGLLIVGGFIGAYLGAAVIGVIISVAIDVVSG